MGLTFKKLTVKKDFESYALVEVEFLIDSGAMHTLIPEPILTQLNIKPFKSQDFVLADGSKISRKMGGAFFAYQGESGYAPVIFGEPGDEPLLGATTLESLGLVLNPFKREIYPMQAINL